MIALRRLAAQHITNHRLSAPQDVVAWLGAVQAQDYAGSKWAVGVRLPHGTATDERIEQALSDGLIIRTHALRGTWQLIAPEDVRWILSLVAPRLIAGAAGRYRQLGLDAATLKKSNATIVKALRSRGPLTRAELAQALARAGISTAEQRLSHLLQRAELDGLACNGPRRGKQLTHALLEERVPRKARVLDRDEALAELANRYFQSRGPATVKDFVWWSGLTVSDARAGIEAARPALLSEELDGETHWFASDAPEPEDAATAHLLPPFDEYLVAYSNRDAFFDPKHRKRINAGGGMLNPCIVVDGRVVGVWRRAADRTTVTIELLAFDAITPSQHQRIEEAAQRYAGFLGLQPKLLLAQWKGD